MAYKRTPVADISGSRLVPSQSAASVLNRSLLLCPPVASASACASRHEGGKWYTGSRRSPCCARNSNQTRSTRPSRRLTSSCGQLPPESKRNGPGVEPNAVQRVRDGAHEQSKFSGGIRALELWIGGHLDTQALLLALDERRLLSFVAARISRLPRAVGLVVGTPRGNNLAHALRHSWS